MQLLEISGERRYLSARRGFLSIRSGDSDLGRIPFDNLLGVIGASHGITISQTLLVRLAKLGIPYVVCDQSFSPVSVAWPTDGNHVQSRVIRKQIEAGKPLKKRLWQAIIRAKIVFQSMALKQVDAENRHLERLASKVRSGDPDNIEAQAARYYWKALLGETFRRHRNGKSPNDLLNYGYTVIRSAMARNVVGCGMHPSISLCHSNRYNPFVLVDDLIEPFRPFIDLRVRRLHRQGVSLDSSAKKALVEVLHFQCGGELGSSTLLQHIQYLARSISRSILDNSSNISFPNPTELELSAL